MTLLSAYILCFNIKCRVEIDKFKYLCLELQSQSDMKEFFDECCRMKDFKHPNVVELIGMCLDSPDGFPLMIFPHYPNGNLKIYLQKSREFSPMFTGLPEVIFSCSIWITTGQGVHCATSKIRLDYITVINGLLTRWFCVCMCVF